MDWKNKTTLHFANTDLEKIKNIEQYLEKQDYFSNDSLPKSRVFSVILNAFYELFVENNSQKSYQKRLNDLKKVVSKDEQRLFQELQTIKNLQNLVFYVVLGNYQNLKQLNPQYTPEELRSYMTGDSTEINILLNRILELQKQDIAHNKQRKDTRRKKSK